MEETEINEIQRPKTTFKDKLKTLWSKMSFKLFVFLFVTLNFIFFIHLIIYGYLGFDYGDGMMQYRIYIEDFIRNFKAHNLSSFNINNFFGTSNYALAYYVPIDIFTFLMILLSYIFPSLDACFCIVRLFAIGLGVMMFYFVQRKVYGFSDKTSFYLSLLWLIGGSLSTFNLFYTYILMYFYIPLTLYVLDLSHKKKIHWPLLLVTILLMFYNFYQGYMIVVCSVVAYFIIDIYKNPPSKSNIKSYLLNELKTYLIEGIFVVFGVLAASSVTIPTIIYLSENSVSSDRGFTFSFIMLLELFARSFISSGEGCWGYVSSNYIEFQRSLFLGVFGYLALVNFIIFNKKDLKKNLITLGVILLLILIPVFSYLFCAQHINYGRWYFLAELVLLFLIGINFENDSINFSNLKTRKRMLFCLTPYVVLIILFATLKAKDSFYNELSEITFLFLTLFETSLVFFYLRFPKCRKKLLLAEIIVFTLVSFQNTAFSSNNINVENSLKKGLAKFEKEINDNSLHKTYFTFYDGDIANINCTTNYLTNDGTMFSSFYNTSLREYSNHYNSKNIYRNEWSFTSQIEANDIASEFFGNKYFMIKKNKDYKIVVPGDYILLFEDDEYYYYQNPNETGFASVYYNSHNNYSENNLQNAYLLNKSCYYAGSKNTYEYSDSNVYELSFANGDFTFNDYDYDENVAYPASANISLSYFKEGKTYYTFYPLFTINKSNEKHFYLGNTFTFTSDIKEVHIVELDNDVTKDKYFTPKLYEISESKESLIEQIDATYNKDTFNITYNKEKEEECIIALPVAYTKDFKSNYEVVSVNGGFVGVIIPANETGEINVEIKFEATGEKTGRVLSIIFGTISLAYVSYAIAKQIKNKKKESE